jgi:hypothetical protein
MNHWTAEQGMSLEAYPNISTAAEILRVSASTLSRRSDLVAERRGERDLVLPAAEVLRLAAIYRKRSLNDVAEHLIELARAVSPDDVGRIEEEVESFFDGRGVSDARIEDFLALARRLLPSSLYDTVEAAVRESDAELPDALIGYPPVPEP